MCQKSHVQRLVDSGIRTSLMRHNAWLLATLLINWSIMTVALKSTEEKWLKNLYGKEYEDYNIHLTATACQLFESRVPYHMRLCKDLLCRLLQS